MSITRAVSGMTDPLVLPVTLTSGPGWVVVDVADRSTASPVPVTASDKPALARLIREHSSDHGARIDMSARSHVWRLFQHRRSDLRAKVTMALNTTGASLRIGELDVVEGVRASRVSDMSTRP